jgi:hypothetical protein
MPRRDGSDGDTGPGLEPHAGTVGLPPAGRRLGRQARLVSRAVRHPTAVPRRIRWLASPRVAYLDLNHDERRAVLLASSGRSGSTWLSEMLVQAFACRVLFEPWRSRRGRPDGAPVWGYFVDRAADDPALAAALGRTFAGRLRGRWVDQDNTVRLPRRRLVKEIRTTNLLPWVAARFPDMPIVFLLRHPVAAARSATDLGWDPMLDDYVNQADLLSGPLAPFADLIAERARSGDLFEQHVLRWCLENLVPITYLSPGAALVVFYESLRLDPAVEFRRVAEYVSRSSQGRWPFDPDRPVVFDRGSLTNYRGSAVATGQDAVDRWPDEVAPGDVDRAVELIAAFGLDRIYDRSPTPRLRPDEVLLGPAASTT